MAQFLSQAAYQEAEARAAARQFFETQIREAEPHVLVEWTGGYLDNLRAANQPLGDYISNSVRTDAAVLLARIDRRHPVERDRTLSLSTPELLARVQAEAIEVAHCAADPKEARSVAGRELRLLESRHGNTDAATYAWGHDLLDRAVQISTAQIASAETH
jgi:hypothetical protein